jgi:hypothetical protein
MTIAQCARLACELFRQLCCSFFKLLGALGRRLDLKPIKPYRKLDGHWFFAVLVNASEHPMNAVCPITPFN